MSTRHSGADLVDLILDQWNRTDPALNVASVAVLGRLHRAELRYQGLVSDHLARFDLTAASFDVLACLRRSGPAQRRTAGQLAELGLITSGGITQRIDRLEKDGLVKRVRDDEDRRKVYVQLTPKGRKAIDEILAIHFDEQEEMLLGLTRSERSQLADLLARLEISLETYERRRSEREELSAG